MTPTQVKQSIHDKGLSVALWARAWLAPSAETKRCADSCCPLACNSSAAQKRVDNKRTISNINMADAQMAATTAPTAHTSTDTLESGCTATDSMATSPAAPKDNNSKLRTMKVLLMASMSCLIAMFFLYSIQINASTPMTENNAVISVAMVFMAVSEVLMFYLQILLSRHLR